MGFGTASGSIGGSGSSSGTGPPGTPINVFPNSPSLTRPDDGLDTSDFIRQRSFEGFYLLTVGNPKSGKTTFQRQLAMCLLTQHKNYASQVVIGAEWKGMRHVNAWQIQFATNGTFPAATKADEITEFHLRTTPSLRPNGPLEFRFIEISGERFLDLVVMENGAPILPDGVNFLLTSERVKLLIVLMIDGGARVGQGIEVVVSGKKHVVLDDITFGNFLTHLGTMRPRGVGPEVSVAVIVSKPDQAIGAELARKPFTHSGRQAALLNFASEKLPATFGILKTNRYSSAVFAMNIGQTASSQVEGAPVMLKPDFSDAHAVFEWSYREFTGRHLRPWLHRLGMRLAGGG